MEAVGCEDVCRLEFWADSDRCCATHLSTQRAETGLSLRFAPKSAVPDEADFACAYTDQEGGIRQKE